MSDPASKSINYRPDIDGLRALAIIGVLIFHLKDSWLPGGFLGVDVFFVISGYLITSIIHREITEVRFSFARFYERRIRRILPAFFAFVFITSIVCAIIMMPTELMAFGKSLRYALFSISNIHFKEATQDYFNADASTFPLLHTWSLGVEEQFYIVIPPLLLLLFRWKNNTITFSASLLILFLLSLIACIWRAQEDTTAAFFLLPYRAWQMLLGALLTTPIAKRFATPLIGNFFAPLGVALILASYIFISSSWYHPALSSIGACIGAAIIILSGAANKSLTYRILSSRPLVAIGLMSYSLYLWHWPIIVILRPILGHSTPTLAGLALFSTFVAWVSWRWIETPWRNPAFLKRHTIFILAAVITLLFLAVSITIKKTDGFVQRYDADVRAMVAHKKPDRRFNSDVKNHYDPKKSLYFGAPEHKNVIAVWGDSHADALMPWLHEKAIENRESLRLFTISAQAPVPGVTVYDGDNDAKRSAYTDGVLHAILDDDKIHTVVMHARWSFYIHGRNEDTVAQRIRYYNNSSKTEQERDKYFADQLKKTTDSLLAAGKRIVLIYPIPEAGKNIPDLLVKRLSKKLPLPENLEIEPFSYRQRYILTALDALPDHPSLIRLRPHEKLLINDRLLIIQVNGQPLYSDDDHISPFGLEHISDLLEKIFPKSK